MAYRDLRDFMDALDSRGLLAQVDAEVDPAWEVNGVTKALLDAEGPAVLFKKISRSTFPMICGTIGTLQHLALALEIEDASLSAITSEWIKRVEHPIQPVLVETGPCKENVLRGSDVDLSIFPHVIWHEKDAGSYIGTLAMQVTSDPNTGERNVGLYRQLITGKDETTLYMPAYQHGGRHYQKWEARGQAMPMAVIFGGDPSILLAASAKVNHPPDEFAYASALRRKPLELVKCETIDLEIPAASEIVLEGEVLPYERKACGPFGEYTGHYSGVQQTPIFKTKAITYRNSAIFQATREGKPPQESALLWVLGKHYEFHRKMMKVPGVKDAAVVLHSSGHHCVVALDKAYPGHPRQICMNIWGDPDFGVSLKQIVVVDPDVNIYDPRDVDWAIATRCQADRDVIIVPGLAATYLDPSQPTTQRLWGSKMGIDATRPTHEYQREGLEVPETCEDEHLVRRVREQWSKYGPDLAKW